MAIFVGLGPLFGGFPFLAAPAVLPALWITGSPPAALAALYYFALTFWWFDTYEPKGKAHRNILFAVLGVISGIAGILSYPQLPIDHAEIINMLFSNKPFSLLLGAVGGAGSGVFVKLIHGSQHAKI
ncbi:MAG: hypothetical protein ABI583_06075 [Betaproteobacteria bacterium]